MSELNFKLGTRSPSGSLNNKQPCQPSKHPLTNIFVCVRTGVCVLRNAAHSGANSGKNSPFSHGIYKQS
jgi:hypothetical protein